MLCLFLDSIFPRSCVVCGAALIPKEEDCCLQCLSSIPRTDFLKVVDNELERLFWGKVEVESGSAFAHFSKSAGIRSLVHELKYRGNKRIGRRIGRMMAAPLQRHWPKPDLILPLPLHPKKQKKRGFNQAEILAEGISKELDSALNTELLIRTVANETQTNKSAEERVENVEGIFQVTQSSALENKTVLLIDDVITTGATMASCVSELNKVAGTKVYVAAVAFASQ